MRRRGSGRVLSLFLFILAGVIIGTIIGNILGTYFSNSKIFTETYEIGSQGAPGYLDLSIVKIALGITFRINFGTVLGLALGLFLYFKS